MLRARVRSALKSRAGVKPDKDQRTAVAARSIARDCSGAAAIEYAFLAALIAVALIMSLYNTSDAVENNWNEVNSAMSDASGMNFNSN